MPRFATGTEWDELAAEPRSKMMARQGVRTVVTDAIWIVADPFTLVPVPADAAPIGEIFFRGNNGMKGYLKNAEATNEAFAGGWYRTGDLAVVHDNGYASKSRTAPRTSSYRAVNISLDRDRGGDVSASAVSLRRRVVAMKDDRWGETPPRLCRAGRKVTMARSRPRRCWSFAARLAKFKLPRKFVFGLIERILHRKVQKFKLRAMAQSN